MHKGYDLKHIYNMLGPVKSNIYSQDKYVELLFYAEIL